MLLRYISGLSGIILIVIITFAIRITFFNLRIIN